MTPDRMPKNSLPRLQRMAATPNCTEIGWTRAIGPTSQRLGISPKEAEEYARQTVQRLVLGDFVSSTLQRGSWYDAYACYRDGLGWFIKVGETDEGLLVMSHHEPENGTLITIAGSVIDVTRPHAIRKKTTEQR